mmetsp:Transcript_98747/g.294896  ORF Transcript_98747/g.294896 Transcript_98747/m.294896 type:complete len:236 (+) Transcript_98747:276-983(+)
MDEPNHLHDEGTVVASLLRHRPSFNLSVNRARKGGEELMAHGLPPGVFLADPELCGLLPVRARRVPANVAPLPLVRAPLLAARAVVELVRVQLGVVDARVLEIHRVHADVGTSAALLLAELSAPDLLDLRVPVQLNPLLLAEPPPRLPDVAPEAVLAQGVFVGVATLLLGVTTARHLLDATQHLGGPLSVKLPESVLVEVVRGGVAGLQVGLDRHRVPLEEVAAGAHKLGDPAVL